MAKLAEGKKRPSHRKKTRQGCGLGTKYGRKRKTIKKYRGQGGTRKSIKR